MLQIVSGFVFVCLIEVFMVAHDEASLFIISDNKVTIRL